MLDVRPTIGPTIGPNAGRTTGHAPPASAQRRAAGGRREVGKAERRARIVQSARDLPGESKGAEVSVRAVAVRTGVSQATPHNLFGCKRAVLVGVLRRDLPVPVLRRMLDAALRGTMLEWAVGELPRPALQASVAPACLLVLHGAATLAGAALLAQRLQRGRPRPGRAGLRQADQ